MWLPVAVGTQLTKLMELGLGIGEDETSSEKLGDNDTIPDMAAGCMRGQITYSHSHVKIRPIAQNRVH